MLTKISPLFNQFHQYILSRIKHNQPNFTKKSKQNNKKKNQQHMFRANNLPQSIKLYTSMLVAHDILMSPYREVPAVCD